MYFAYLLYDNELFEITSSSKFSTLLDIVSRSKKSFYDK